MGARPVIPAVGTGFLPFNITSPPIPVPLPVDYEATYASVGGPAPILVPIMPASLTMRVRGDADAFAEYGSVSNNAKITVVSLLRSGVYAGLLVDAVELMGGTDACAPKPNTIVTAGPARPVSTIVGG
jgi:hypothetical protein